MFTKKFEELVKKDNTKSLLGLFLKEGEKGRLYDICVKYNISIRYPRLFQDDTHYYLWGIGKDGIGLISTIVMNYLEQNNGVIFNSLDELEDYLKENKDYEKNK